MASRIFPGNKVTSFPPTKESVQYIVEELDNITNQWTVPSGVTKIFATLIGAGGDLGFLSTTVTTAINNDSQVVNGFAFKFPAASNAYPNTTLTVNGTTYTALGGLEGLGATGTATLTIPTDTSGSFQ